MYELILVILLGVVTSITDIKYGKIRNIHLLIALSLGVVLQLFYSPGWLTIVNALMAIIVGYMLWEFGLWTAGDGKLFTVYAIIIPIVIYNPESMIPLFPSMNILINTVTPLYAVFFVSILLKSTWAANKVIIKRITTRKQLLMLGGMVFLFSLLSILMSEFVQLNYFVSLVIFFLMYSILKKFHKIVQIGIIASLCLAAIPFIESYENFLFSFVVFFFSFLIFRMFALELGFSALTRPVAIKDLKPGMVIADMIVKEKQSVKKKRILFFSLFGYLKEKPPVAEGVDLHTIKHLKLLAKKNPELTHLRVHETIPFAPFIFVGALLTIIVHGNIFLIL